MILEKVSNRLVIFGVTVQIWLTFFPGSLQKLPNYIDHMTLIHCRMKGALTRASKIRVDRKL
jgi:hypothetical protein